MPADARSLHLMVERSRPLRERIQQRACDDSARSHAIDAVSQETCDLPALLTAWCELSASGNWPLFEKRLSWDGLRAADIAAIVARSAAGVVPDHGATIPGWAATLHDAYDSASTDGPSSGAASALDADALGVLADEPLPFEELMRPLVAHACRRVAAQVPTRAAYVHDRAHQQLVRALLRRLCHVFMRVAYAEFTVFRTIRRQLSVAELFAGPGADERALYRQFTQRMLDGEIARVFAAYPVVARLLATAADLWVEATTEFYTRLAADQSLLQEAFGGDRSLGAVCRIKAELSDPHDGGRSVFIVEWESGMRAVYKPRPLGLEVRLAGLAAWLADDPAVPSLRVLRVVARDGYGWLEFAANAPCADPEEVERYFARCGALLCVMYALNGGDLHYENLIASGEHPVLIDLETLLSPKLCAEAAAEARPEATGGALQHCTDSVLSVRMLPELVVNDDGTAVNLGGLGGADVDGASALVYRWKSINSDAMRLVQVRIAREAARHNLPELNGRPVEARDHVRALTDGFVRTYRSILARRDQLLRDDSPLFAMRGEQVRVLFRNTNLYSTLLERTLQPVYLRDALDRSVQLDALARPFLAQEIRPRIWQIVDAEHVALERLDVPLFSARADSTTVHLPDGTDLPDGMECSAFAQAVRRVESLSDDDLELQQRLIAAAFDANGRCELESRALRARAGSVSAHDDTPDLAMAPLDRRAALAGALTIAERLRASAFEYDAMGVHCASWIGPEYLPRARRYRLGALGHGLLDGSTGVALFLAAVARVSNSAQWHDLARSALVPFEQLLPHYENTIRMRRLVDVGAGTGVASIVYAHVQCARLLDDPSLLEHAHRVASLITRDVVARNNVNDVVSAAAGAVLGLLSLHEATGDSDCRERAVGVGELLLERADAARDASDGTVTLCGQDDVGVAHGNAGIALALHRLGTFTQSAAYTRVAAELLDIEQRRHAGQQDRLEERGSWSRGPVGTAMVLQQTSGASYSDFVRSALASQMRALEGAFDTSIVAQRGAANDAMAIGSGAGIGLLLAAAPSRPEYALAARRLGAQIAARVARGQVATGWTVPNGCPGLFYGESGIGLSLLRLHDAAVLPSPLLWQ
jgi:type 2 lantibiotic biosynthesis protein LanM